MILVKQNNFEKNAIMFVDSHRSIDSSVIYDYKIDHKDGSVLKVFITGETLSASGRSNLYAYAKEYGINEQQLVVKEYITKNSQDNETIFKGIYERLDSEIEEYESRIDQLTKELHEARKDELPYLQIANEVAAAYPSIKHIHLAQGAHIALDSLNVSPCLLVKVQSDSLMSESSLMQFKKWIQVRLQVENVEVYNEM